MTLLTAALAFILATPTVNKQGTSGGNTTNTTVLAPDYYSAGRRIGFTVPIDASATTLAPVGLPAVVQSTGSASMVWANDAASDTTRDMVKATETNAGANASMSMVSGTGTMRQLLPKFSMHVNLGQNRIPSASGTYSFGVGLASQTIGSAFCASLSGAPAGFWFCAQDISTNPAAGLNWVACIGNGTNIACFNSGVPITLGLHSLAIDLSVISSVTYTIDATTFTKTTTDATFPATTAQMGCVFTLTETVLTATNVVSTAGCQIVQNY